MASVSPPTATPPAQTPEPPTTEPGEQRQEEQELFFLSLNPTAETTLVLLHGVTSCHLEWAHVIPHLLPDYHLLVVDLPGHSGSASVPGPYTLPRMADAVARVIEKHAHTVAVSNYNSSSSNPNPNPNSNPTATTTTTTNTTTNTTTTTTPLTTHPQPPHTKPSQNKNKKKAAAHIIALSLGGFVSLHLLKRHPSLCLSLHITGCAPFSSPPTSPTPSLTSKTFTFLAAHPSIPYYMMTILNSLPSFIYSAFCRWGGMLPHEELRAEMKRNAKWEVVRDVYSSILRDCDWELVRELGDLQVGIDNNSGDQDGEDGEDGKEGQRGVRILVVAAGKQDDVEAAREMGRVWREEDHLVGAGERGGTRTKSKAAVVRGAVHAWNLQFPEVFAEGIKAWVEGREELPVEYEELV